MTSTTTDRVNSGAEPSPSTVATLVGEEPQVDAQALAEALDPQLVARLAATARAQGVSLLGRDGLLRQVTRRFLEAALQAEMDTRWSNRWKAALNAFDMTFDGRISATRR